MINLVTLKDKAVNFHISEACNMSCSYCYAKYQKELEVNKKQSLEIIDALIRSGVAKINFAGGEPFLKSYLGELIQFAKAGGLATGVITNGSYLTKSWLAQYGSSLDWLGVSIDSKQDETLKVIGRLTKRGQIQNLEKVVSMLNLANSIGCRIKVNTVVSKFNYKEDLTKLINKIKPHRWKVFQALPIEGANSDNDFLVSNQDYQSFKTKNSSVNEHITVCFESNDCMTSSYIMISPQGKFYCNGTGQHHYSEPILQVGISQAFNQVSYDHKKFTARGGITQ